MAADLVRGVDFFGNSKSLGFLKEALQDLRLLETKAKVQIDHKEKKLAK